MKVLHLLSTNKFSGAENVACQIINMHKNNKNLEMAYCSCYGPIEDTLKDKKIKFIGISKLNCKEVKRAIKSYKPDIIHAHDMKASFIASLSCGSIPLISHIHNNAFNSRGISLKSIAYLFAAKKARHIFWVSNSSYEGYKFHRRFKEKSSILYNVIDTEELFNKMNLDKQLYNYDIVYLGRLTFQKNPERLINVMKMVVDQKKDAKLAIIGIGDLEQEVKQLVTKLNLNDNISFLGYQSNPLKMLHDAKVMVMTSRWEGTPMCALEALALGIPIIATPVDGLKDLVINEWNGYVSDDDYELANKIVDILKDKHLMSTMKKNAIKKSEEINNIDNYKKEIDKYYYESK